MADKKLKWPNNVKGKLYVDQNCIDCDACRTEAPNHFTRDEEHGYSFVHRQPQTPEEEAQCRSAMAACPVEAIGDDGESNEENKDQE